MFSLYIVSISLAVIKALSVFKSDLPMFLSSAGEIASLVPLERISTALLGLMVISAAATNAFSQ